MIKSVPPSSTVVKNILLFIYLLFSNLYVFSQEPICATPGSDGVQAVPAPQNSFFPGLGDDITVPQGATSFDLDPIPDPFTVGGVLYDFGNNQISKGDLLLIIQIQGASINSTNTAAYGSGNAANNGSGYIDLNNVGRYEYMVALNEVTSAGGTLNFQASGPGGGLLFSYENKPADANNGVKRFQVIRLMQYSDLTLTADVKTTPWNGKAGGLIAIDVAGTLDFNGRTIDASMTGFRGGYLPAREPIPNEQFLDYRSNIYTPANSVLGSTKGEGIAGTPRHVWDGYEYTDLGAGWIGYPGGDLNRGAPGNAGGGGNVHNAGGGGGGNGGAGGAGGYGWPLANETPQTNNRNNQLSLLTGGRPGVAMPSNVSNGLLFMGGGGGAGDANDSPDGARGGVGGGIVLITANKVVGNGYILANGGKGEPGSIGGSGDGAGGGGAGGSVFISVKQPSTGTLTIQAKGGDGGHSTTDVLHGPGGGGGGGIIYYNVNGVSVSTDVSPGIPGLINSGDPVNPNNYANFPIGQNKLNNGAFTGMPGISSSFTPDEQPPYLATSAYCYPELTITKWRDNPLDSIPAGSMITYKIRIDNEGGGAKGVRINDELPGGFMFVSATIDFDTDTGNPQPLGNIGTPTNPVLGTFNLITDEGAYIEMLVQVPFTTPIGTYHNGIQVGYLDPTREIGGPERVIFPPTHALPGQNTDYIESDDIVGGSNYHPSQEGEEVVVKRPIIYIEKTIDDPCVKPGGNTYSIVLRNPNPYIVSLFDIPVTDVIDPELNVINVDGGTSWTYFVIDDTYTLILEELPPGTPENPYESEPIYITVEPKNDAEENSWLNIATIPNPTESGGVLASSVWLYQIPTTPTAEDVTPTGACDNGVYWLEGNIPEVGIGKWEFLTGTHPQGSAYFENPNQTNSRIFGMAPGQTVEVVWTITNSECGRMDSDPLLFTAPVPPTATISGGGSICAGAPVDTAPAITVTLTPTAGRKRIRYLDGGGFTRTLLSANNATSIDIPRNYTGTYTLVEVKQSTTITDVNSSDWDSVCPGTTSGVAQITVITQAPASGVINYHGSAVCRGTTVPMSFVLSGSGTILGWQSSTNGTTWSAIIPGTANLTSYSPVVNNNIYYRVEIGSSNPACFPDSNFSSVVLLTVKDCNDLSISKTIDDETPDAGATVTFTITVTNEKEQNATGVKVQDKLPNGYTYAGNHTATQGTYYPGTGLWDIGTLNAGQSRVLTIEAEVNQSGQYTNKAVVSCNEQETDYTNNTAEVTPDVNCDVRNVSPKVN